MAVHLPQQAKRHWTQQRRLEHFAEQWLAHPMLEHALERLPTEQPCRPRPRFEEHVLGLIDPYAAGSQRLRQDVRGKQGLIPTPAEQPKIILQSYKCNSLAPQAGIDLGEVELDQEKEPTCERQATAACLSPGSLHPGQVGQGSPIGPRLLKQAMQPVWIHGADAVVNIAADDPQPIANQACRMRFDRSERYSSAGWEAAE